MELSINIYLYNYQTETAIFIATKLEKTITAVIWIFINISFILNFWPAILVYKKWNNGKTQEFTRNKFSKVFI